MYRWVPRHVKVRGNEIADELLRKGAEKIPVGPELIIKVTQQYVKEWIRGNVFQERSYKWREQGEGLSQSGDFIVVSLYPKRIRRLLGLGLIVLLTS